MSKLYACKSPNFFQESAAGNPQRFHKRLLRATNCVGSLYNESSTI
jgi:hypothetical protein